MVAMQEGVPVVPAAIYGSHDLEARQLRPSRSPGASRCASTGCRRAAGYSEATAEIERRIRACSSGSPRCTRAAGHGARAAARERRPTTTPECRGSPRLLGTVAIVGFPNVGKSTLDQPADRDARQAVVHETPGVTRDRKELVCEWAGKRFLLVDTGGVDVAGARPLSPLDRRAGARRGRARPTSCCSSSTPAHGVTPGDEEIAEILRRSQKPVLVVANKIDDPAQGREALEFHRLGLGDPVPVSAMHGHGTGDLLDRIVAARRASGRGAGRATRRSASRSSAGRTWASRASSTRSSARSA